MVAILILSILLNLFFSFEKCFESWYISVFGARESIDIVFFYERLKTSLWQP